MLQLQQALPDSTVCTQPLCLPTAVVPLARLGRVVLCQEPAAGLCCEQFLQCHPPAMAMGVAAPLMDMVLKISTSVMKCTRATTKDNSVAPVAARCDDRRDLGQVRLLGSVQLS